LVIDHSAKELLLNAAKKIESSNEESIQDQLHYSQILYQMATGPVFGGITYALDHCLKVIVAETEFEISNWFWKEGRNDKNFENSEHWHCKDNNVNFKVFQDQSKKLIIEEKTRLYQDLILSRFLFTVALTEKKWERLNLSSASEFQTALFLPIHLKPNLYGVIEFYSTKKIKANSVLFQFFENLSGEINRQIENINNQEAEKQQVFQLAQASRLSSLGAMAGGIAHEINNPLTIIMGTIKVAIRSIEGDLTKLDQKKTVDSLNKARSHTERITKIVKGIRALSRDGANDPFVLSKVKDILEDTLNLCEARIKTNNIQLSFEIEDDELMLQCRPVQVSQVLLNLINNSMDAVGELPNPWINLSANKVGNVIEFKLTDAGPGIPEHIANQLMQPFFTTKGTGRGTGLGLSISQEIVKTHSGRFYLNRDFKHTQFIVQFPVEQAAD
jgi:C4-dicarboxylate-specific signal transduction histidine kinase